MYREGLDVGESMFVVGFYRPGWCSPEKDCFWLCLTFDNLCGVIFRVNVTLVMRFVHIRIYNVHIRW